ncbi:HD domain-containing protein [Brassicibacter mesophilus]|uniref:HD domain-containing protein n=1 Tax=Brassicibacter mesophilus TaxID=745119 RepID=UPI003D21A686
MEFLLARLKEISKNQNTKIYIIGNFIRDFVLGTRGNCIDCIVQDKIEIIATLFANEISSKAVTIDENNRTYKVVDITRDITLNFSKMNGNRIEDDLMKRDFTINSLAIDVLDFDCNVLDETKIIDPTSGLMDINREKIVYVYEDVFKDDPVRILKAVRLMSELGFDMDDRTKRKILSDKCFLKTIVNEKLTDELFQILRNKKTYYYFSFMDKHLNVLEEIFPEIIPMKDVGQCKYHVVNSFTHSLLTLKTLEEIIYHNAYFEEHVRESYERHGNESITYEHTRLELIKLAAFFHDVGKPKAKKVDEAGRTRFKGHEIIGAEAIRSIAERLGLSLKEKDILHDITAKHMIPLVLYKDNDVSGKALYSMFSDLKDNTLDVLLISLSDIIATRKVLQPDEDMGKYKIHIEYLANNYLTRFKESEKTI